MYHTYSTIYIIIMYINKSVKYAHIIYVYLLVRVIVLSMARKQLR